MKHFTLLFLVVLLLSFSKKNRKVNYKNESSVVLQLFTSQGCSSCPSADAFLEIVKNDFADKNVLVLSYHVDYWNSLGWHDPFSKKEFTELQYAYGKELKADNIYTPQLIVNGKEHYVGSYKKTILKSIVENLKHTSKNPIDFNIIKKTGSEILISYTVDGNLIDKKLQFTLVVENKITKVKRGENTNRTISNSNIVIATTSKKIKSKNGTVLIKIPDAYLNDKNLRLIGFVENKQLQISGAAQVKV
jgi:hypothetical protein